jgi:hypothetical protein
LSSTSTSTSMTRSNFNLKYKVKLKINPDENFKDGKPHFRLMKILFSRWNFFR